MVIAVALVLFIVFAYYRAKKAVDSYEGYGNQSESLF